MLIHEFIGYYDDYERLKWLTKQFKRQFKHRSCDERIRFICSHDPYFPRYILVLDIRHSQAHHIKNEFRRFVKEQNELNPWSHLNYKYCVTLKDTSEAPLLRHDRSYVVECCNKRAVCLKTTQGLRWYELRKFTKPELDLPF